MLYRTGSAVGLSPNDAELFADGKSTPDVEDDGPTPDQGPTFVGSVIKQESGRLTVMFPAEVPGLDDPRNLWR